MKPHTSLAALAALALVVGVAPGAGAHFATPDQLGPGDADVEQAYDACPDDAHVVLVKNYEFDDTEIQAPVGTPVTSIEPGQTVCWVWLEGSHSATQGVRGPYGDPVGPSVFDSGVLSAQHDRETGQPLVAFTHTFEDAGAFQYYCRPHQQQNGAVVVGTSLLDAPSTGQGSWATLGPAPLGIPLEGS